MNLTASKNSPAPPPRRTPRFPRSPGGRRLNFRVPMTPLLRWKLEDRHGSRGRIRVQSQARKLAAGLWQLHYREISGGDGGCRRRSQVEIRHRHGDLSRNGGGVEAEQRLQRRCCSNNGIQIKGAVKEYWSPETPEKAEAAASGRFYSHRGGGEQPHTVASATSDMKKELAVAQTRIRKLKFRQQISKKKIEHLTGKLEENRAMWKNQKHLKLDELDQETKTHYRTETLNAKLAKELAEAKANIKKYKQEYEKERKNRELLEEVCTEMASEIVGDRAKVEALKRESMKLCEELEEEKNMLQMAEVWREERIQMKLIDAKLALEDKYIQMNKLIIELENFLMSRSEKLDEMELKRAESIHRAAKSLDIDEVEGYFYEPEKQSLVLSLLQDLKEASKLEGKCEEINEDLVENGCVSERKTECFENPFDDSSKRKVNLDAIREGGELKCSDSVSQRNSQNPHIKRGTHGCIEWPRGIQKNCFKAKTLDAKIQSQKSQLRHVLKHNELNVVLKKMK